MKQYGDEEWNEGGQKSIKVTQIVLKHILVLEILKSDEILKKTVTV